MSNNSNNVLTLRNVFYQRRAGQHPVLKGISFSAHEGQTVAIVGPSGSGKTTLASLLAGLLSPSSGTVTYRVDGESETNCAEFLSKHSAVVFRDSFIFSRSIMRNITYGCPDAPYQAAVSAARIAQIHDCISQLPHSYDTLLGHQGVNMSSGQAQRIAIARAILKNPGLLILDEATSALDHQSEDRLRKALLEMTQRSILIIISHRLSSIVDADRIVVLKEGEIAAVGTHADLLTRDATYRDIFGGQIATA